MFVSTLALLVVVCVDFVSGEYGCISNYPIIRNTIRLPRGSEILSVRDFDQKVVGNKLHSFMSGIHPSRESGKLEKTELVYTRPSENNVRFELKTVVNGDCSDGPFIRNNELDIVGNGDRAEFKTADSGTHLSVFSSEPESYLWVLVCLNHYDGIPRCRTENLIANLFTFENPPSNINLELMGRDLRIRTCLTMEEITGYYNFRLAQGENTCPDNDG